MTDKTAQNNTGNTMNDPAASSKTNTTPDSEPQIKALPQADALKARFKAGSIPLQTDFANLIDLANMGRQAVGGAEDQTGPANGFTLSSTGLLELKPNTAKGISIDQDGVAIKLKTISGLTMDNSGVSVKPKADSGIELKDSAGISLKPGNGISVDRDGIAVKVEGNKGLQVNNYGVSVKVGNGVAVNNSGVNIKLAKGLNTNGGEGHGMDGATSGSGGGLNLTANGLSVDAGDGIQINTRGVSIKLTTNSGLSANEANGLKILTEGGIQIGSSGAINVRPGNGVVVNYSGVNIKLAKGYETNTGGGQGTDGTTAGSAGGLNLTSNGLSVDAGDGIQINTRGVSIKLATNSGLSANESSGLKIITEGAIQIGSSGGINIKPGNGVDVTDYGVNVKLSKGTYNDNGGGGQGTNGTTSGCSGGLVLSSDGLSVDAGSGIRIDPLGVSIKLNYKSCLTADEPNGLSLSLPVGFGMLCKTTYNPNSYLVGTWSRYNNITVGYSVFSVWIREY